jgi:hypothetical protein
MLTKDPECRPEAAELLRHRWFAEAGATDLGEAVSERLRAFREKCR